MPPPRKRVNQRIDSVTNPPRRPADKPAPQGPKTCCDSPDLAFNDEGEQFCANCGTVTQAASNIVADVTFQEDSRGAAAVQGGYIGENARHAHTMGAAGRRLGGGEHNNQATIDSKGREELAKICPRLRLPEKMVSIARTHWNVSSTLGFGTGRKTEEVIGACVYAACRTDRANTVLLMDIAELVKVNVFRLGEVYKALVKALMLAEQPVSDQAIIEVEPLILKFCKKLDFGDQTRVIANDAVKILQRMKRDWIVPGRHPGGVSGACILLAARMNGLRRSVREMVYIVRVADVTVAARMEEFKLTPAAALSANLFREKGPYLKKTLDPPAMKAADQRLAKLERQRFKRQIAEVDREAVDGQRGSPQATSLDASGSTTTPDASQQASQSNPLAKRRRTKEANAAADLSANSQALRVDGDGFAIPSIPASAIDPALTNAGSPSTGDRESSADVALAHNPDSPKQKRGRKKKSTQVPAAPSITDDDLISTQQFEQEIERILDDREFQQAASEQEVARAEEAAKAMGKEQRAKGAEAAKARRQAAGIDWVKDAPADAPADPSMDADDGSTLQPSVTAEQLEAEFENDPEVTNCLLRPEEVQLKEKIWVASNEDWLRAQYEKSLKAQIQKTDGTDKKRKGGKRKKKGRLGDGSLLADSDVAIETAADANDAMLRKHGGANFSRFLNYDTLINTYGARGPSSSRSGSLAPGSNGGTPVRIAPSPARASATPNPALPTPQPTQAQATTGAEPAQEEVDDDGQDDDPMNDDDDQDGNSPEGYGGSDNDEDWEAAVHEAGGGMMGDGSALDEYD